MAITLSTHKLFSSISVKFGIDGWAPESVNPYNDVQAPVCTCGSFLGIEFTGNTVSRSLVSMHLRTKPTQEGEPG